MATKALKFLQTLLYLLLFGIVVTILGIYAYFVATIADHDGTLKPWVIIVACIAAAATLYLLFAVVFTCCLGGVTFFSSLAVILDIFFAGCFIAVAVLTRHGASRCDGYVRTPLGDGDEDSGEAGYDGGFGLADDRNVVYKPRLDTACNLNRAVFGLSIVAAFLFLASAIHQVLLARTRRREKLHEATVVTDHDTGRGRVPFWKKKLTPATATTTRDPEGGLTGAAVAGTAVPPVAGSNLGYTTEKPAHDMRPSHDTAYTGSTMAPANTTYNNKYEQPGAATTGQTGYYTAPTGTTTSTSNTYHHA